MAALITASSSIGRIRYSCKYPSCKNAFYSEIKSKDYVNKKFHRFPRDSASLQAWKIACNLSPTKNCAHFYVCQDHFSNSDYANPNNPTRLSLIAYPHSPTKPQQISATNESSLENSLVDNNSLNSSLPRILFPIKDTPILSETIPLVPDDKPDETVVSPSCSHEVDHSDHKHLPKGSSKCSKMASDYFDKYSFLLENKKGILGKAGLSKRDLTPTEEIMYREHRNITSKLSKLRTLLKNERADVNSLKHLYEEGRFQFIEENLNQVSKEFINSQLRNVNKSPNGRRWTIQDKAFALSIYKRSPRLYRYLRAYFQLPSIRILKNVLSCIPFQCGMIRPALEHLKLQTENMDELDRCCTLIFDEMSLSRGFYYESHRQKICGFEDLGILGRNENAANHALVFMVRGVRKNFKMPVGFFLLRTRLRPTP